MATVLAPDWPTSSAEPTNPPPRYSTPRTPDRPTLGGKVAQVSAMLGAPLMPWQRHVVDVALELDPDTGLPVYREVVLLVPRQSGKSTLFRALSVHRCFADWGGPQTVRYTAQTLAAAREKWREDFLEALDESDLRHAYETRLANGSEGMKWANGSHFGLMATMKKSGHGSTIDLALIDEAFAQIDGRLEQAARPAMSTRDSAQMWITSTAGESPAESPYLWRKVEAGRERVRDGKTDSVAYFEWSDDTGDPADPATWRATMPALGHTVSESVIRADFEAMEIAEFCRAYLCRWGVGSVDGPIPLPAWDALGVSEGELVGSVTLGVDVSPDRGRASIVAVADGGDGRPFVEVVENRQGVGWLVPRLGALVAKHDVSAVVLDRRSQAGSLIDDITAAELPLVAADTRELITACGRFYDRVTTGGLAHLGQPELASAVAGAKRRTVADAWALSRKSSAVDISPLVAAVLGLWCFETGQTPADAGGSGPVFLY